MSGGIAINRAGFAVVVGGSCLGLPAGVGGRRMWVRGGWSGVGVFGEKRESWHRTGASNRPRRPFGDLAGVGAPRSGERWCGGGDSGWLKSVDPGVFTSAVRPAASAFTSATKVRCWCVP